MDPDFGAASQILTLELAQEPKVLLVDDDELVLARLEGLITEAGFKVSTALDAKAALASLKKTFTPIVITDRNMPGMDGLELCRHIRQRTWPGYVYLLLLTVQDAEEDILGGLDAGADDYLSKRTSATQLIARLRTARRILTLEYSLKGALEEKNRMAMTDMLTGAHNRRYFMRHLDRELKRMQRFGGNLSLLALDIDFFKRINDRYGHAAGDAVLQEFVRRIAERLRPGLDWCARIGGEEFVVVLSETDLKGAGAIAEKLRLAVSGAPMRAGNDIIEATVSIGVSTLKPGGQDTVESLLSVADDCLYISKEKGRNRVTLPAA